MASKLTDRTVSLPYDFALSAGDDPACLRLVQLLRATKEGADLDDLRREKGIKLAYATELRGKNIALYSFNKASRIPRLCQETDITICINPSKPFGAEQVARLKDEIKHNVNVLTPPRL